MAQVAHYRVHGILGISVVGSDTPAGRVIDEDLWRFRAEKGAADLTIVLGGALEPRTGRAVALGAGLYFDAERGELILCNDERPLAGDANVRYAIRGDVRKGDPVTVHVPNLVSEPSRWRRARRALLRGKFSSPVRRQVNRIQANLVEPFLYYRLPSTGHSLVHGAGVSNGSGIVLFGSSNVGKTLLTLRLVGRGLGFLGDDLLIVDANGSMLAYPKRINLERQDLAAHPGLVQRLAATMPLLERFALRRNVRRPGADPFRGEFRAAAAQVLDDGAVRDSAALRAVVHLRRGVEDAVALEEIDPAEGAKRVAAELFWEFNAQVWHFARLPIGFAHVAGRDFAVDEAEHHARVRRLLSSALSNAKAFELRLPARIAERDVERAVEAVASLP